MKTWIVISILLTASIAEAQYTHGVVVGEPVPSPNGLRVGISIEGANVPPTDPKEFVISSGQSLDEIQKWVYDQITTLNSVETLGKNNQYRKGTVINPLPRGNGIPSALQVFTQRFNRCLRYSGYPDGAKQPELKAAISAMCDAVSEEFLALSSQDQAAFLDGN